MGVAYDDGTVVVHAGDCRRMLAALSPDSIDAVVTDPPYDLTGTSSGGFMGHAWDATAVAFDSATWAAAARILKPGGHILAFGGSRTWHRLACAIEDAGMEIRDSIAWLHGQGWPKSRDISDDLAASGSPRARPGIGSALKPAFEPIVVARKPVHGRLADNVDRYGVGGLNIDACRIQHASETDRHVSEAKNRHADWHSPAGTNHVYGDFTTVTRSNYDGSAGRWPPNVALDDELAHLLDQAGPVRVTRQGQPRFGTVAHAWDPIAGQDDVAGASRFFPVFRYCPKAGADQRPRIDGISHPTVKPLDLMRWLVKLVTPYGGRVCDPFLGSGTTALACVMEGRTCIGAENHLPYLPLIVHRLTLPLQLGLDV